MKKAIKIFIKIIIAGLIFAIAYIVYSFAPIIPIQKPAGWNYGGEFCGIEYRPECDEITTWHISIQQYFKLRHLERMMSEKYNVQEN